MPNKSNAILNSPCRSDASSAIAGSYEHDPWPLHTPNASFSQGTIAYDVVFLSASAGAEDRKARVIAHLGEHMADGTALLVRSAHGARGFLCPVVDPADVVRGGF